jgi:hypothetical protein
VILRVVGTTQPQDAGRILSESGLKDIRPFRLVGVYPAKREVNEWTWNGTVLHSHPHRWEANHWFSSGMSDQLATELRGDVFESGWKQNSAGAVEWLRQMHKSHLPERGAFSVCVHREDAATLSYTEIEIASLTVSMHYHDGAPCLDGPEHKLTISRILESVRQ